MKKHAKKVIALALSAVMALSTFIYVSAADDTDASAQVSEEMVTVEVVSAGSLNSYYSEGDVIDYGLDGITVYAATALTLGSDTTGDFLRSNLSNTNYTDTSGNTISTRLLFKVVPSATGNITVISGATGKPGYVLEETDTEGVFVITSTTANAETITGSLTAGKTYYIAYSGTNPKVYSFAYEKTESEVVYTNVMPTTSSFVSTFDFTDSSSDTVKLVTQSNESYLAGTAYAANAGTDYDDYCYVELTEDGAVLTDNSANSSTRLIVPYENKTSKVRIYGSVIPTNAVSTNWRIITFGNGLNLGVNKNKSMYIDLSEDLSTSTGETAFGTVAAGQAIEFDLTFDLDSCTATGTITNGDTTGEVNTTWASSTKYTQRVTYYTTLSQAGETARTIVVPSVSFEEKPVFDADSMTITGLDGSVYYVVPVTSEQQSENTGFYLVSKNDSSNKSEEGDTVYIGLTVDEAEFSLSDLGITDPYVVAFEITGSGIDVDTIKDKYEMQFVPGDSASEE